MAASTSRLMLPDDANPAGNVHGGTILKMIDETASIAANRHLLANAVEMPDNGGEGGLVRAALVRVEETSFKEPMFVGDVARLEARVTFVSPHSMEVTVDVYAERLRWKSGDSRDVHTNHAVLWFAAIAVSEKKMLGPQRVPPLAQNDDSGEGEKRYKAQKQQRSATTERLQARVNSPTRVEDWTVPYTVLSQAVLPSDANVFGFLRGGVLMKIMDSAAGITAAKHCRTNVVTVSLEAIDFHEPIHVGEVVKVTAFATFTSARSLEIEVTVDAENVVTGQHRHCASTAFFVFVSLDSEGKTIPVPPVEPKTAAELEHFRLGEEHYMARKARR
eukprot:NODE_2225_length_1258_cov_43.287841_g2026_i0.p1 GENE.NODE_2225_length_1258_cov_43.287841_g2026_i0~~NODE_2225_length_1258_cov_43.287841_g2026_i0.p1  ORF type:complete len:356 (+),score=79.62 NODE_2225_length_1258_cov_43.287841_g2026_i0:75-1070(+)